MKKHTDDARKEIESAQKQAAQPAQPTARPHVAQPTAEQRIAELTETLKRLQADFENSIKQADKRQTQMCDVASARVLIRILSIVDDFERSLKTLEDAKIDPQLMEGMRMVNKNIHGVLVAEGVKPIECIGKKLDPFRHEVLRRVKKEGVEDDIIVEEHVKGYLLKDKVLRHSKVTVVSNGGESV